MYSYFISNLDRCKLNKKNTSNSDKKPRLSSVSKNRLPPSRLTYLAHQFIEYIPLSIGKVAPPIAQSVEYVPNYSYVPISASKVLPSLSELLVPNLPQYEPLLVGTNKVGPQYQQPIASDLSYGCSKILIAVEKCSDYFAQFIQIEEPELLDSFEYNYSLY